MEYQDLNICAQVRKYQLQKHTLYAMYLNATTFKAAERSHMQKSHQYCDTQSCDSKSFLGTRKWWQILHFFVLSTMILTNLSYWSWKAAKVAEFEMKSPKPAKVIKFYIFNSGRELCKSVLLARRNELQEPLHKIFHTEILYDLTYCTFWQVEMKFWILTNRVWSLTKCDNFEGSWPEWCVSSMIYSRDIPFWSGTLDL